MKVDGAIMTVSLDDVPERVRELEALGYDGAYTFEGPHDPFFPVLLAAEHTERLELATTIAIAFARNPMTLANIGRDLNDFAGGRFILGLGSQIQPHIEKRFSMPWSAPARRMRELVLAMRAIWASWQDGTKLRFEGEFYRHTLMTPMFDPGPSPYGPPRVWLAGIGVRMTEVAGEVADGFIVHPFCSEKFLREHTRPALERGFALAAVDPSRFEVAYPVLVVSGDTDEEFAVAEAATRRQLGFYGSTPAYKPVLDMHGWGDLQPELNRMTKEGRWDELGSLITDEMLETFAVRGTPDELPHLIRERFGDLVDRVSVNAPYQADAKRWSAVVDGFRAAH
jgi:probable F420-dependent oxidoreductase